MIKTLPGLHTGTVDEYTTQTNERFRFVPSGPLSLVTNEPRMAEDFPHKIAANPSAEELIERLTGAKRPWYTRWFNVKKRLVRESARMFIGFNVNDEQGLLLHKWRATDAYETAYLLRRDQLEGSNVFPAFSYYVGLGAFPGTGGVTTEKSAQVVMVNFGQNENTFIKQMIELSRNIANRLHQESVMLELSDRRGIFELEYVPSSKKMSVDSTLSWLDQHRHEFDEETIKIS